MHDLQAIATDTARFDRNRFAAIRAHTEALVLSLSGEDQGLQSMPDASPAKWHRAHTTWFFEEFVLLPFAPGYTAYADPFRYLFNSYYEAVGPRHPRPMRGLLSRPSAADITAYRHHVDTAMHELPEVLPIEAIARITLGLQHEQQHQELLVTDMLHAFAQHPACPAMLPGWQAPPPEPGPTIRLDHDGGLHHIGHAGDDFAFDNETPRHRVFVEPFALASHLLRNRDVLGFIADGGYETVTLWMSDGWQAARAGGWSAPLHWRGGPGEWQQATPGGLRPLDPAEPARHLSWYEADAIARWAGARLPTEAEWEIASTDPRLREQTGHVWQWTGSAYTPYPGYVPPAGAIGEYNGKFMINQMVLRGGSMATPAGHARPGYRNFFHPDRRWQFSGVRLAWSR